MRLIDAEILKSQLYESILVNEDMDCLDFLRVASLIDAQQTAYSVEQVVDELDMARTNNNGLKFELIPFDKVAEIVKNCGVSDDVCEWKLEDEEANLYLTECQQRQLIFDGTPKENGYRYCPYCGKKIKVVE